MEFEVHKNLGNRLAYLSKFEFEGWFIVTKWIVEPYHVLWMMLVNALILSISLLLFFGAAYVLACAWNEHRLTKQVSPRLALVVLRVFAWRPVIGFVAFLLAGLVFLRFVIFGHDFLNFLLFAAPLLMVCFMPVGAGRRRSPLHRSMQWLNGGSPEDRDCKTSSLHNICQ